MVKKTIRLTESDLHRIVKESVKRILNEENLEEGLFGNDSRYGEKWYNPMSWKSDAQKKQIRQQRYQAETDAFNKQLQQKNERERRDREAEESNKRMMQYARRDRQGGYGSSGWGSGYRQNNRTDQAGHIRAFDDELAAYDAGLR